MTQGIEFVRKNRPRSCFRVSDQARGGLIRTFFGGVAAAPGRRRTRRPHSPAAGPRFDRRPARHGTGGGVHRAKGRNPIGVNRLHGRRHPTRPSRARGRSAPLHSARAAPRDPSVRPWDAAPRPRVPLARPSFRASLAGRRPRASHRRRAHPPRRDSPRPSACSRTPHFRLRDLGSSVPGDPPSAFGLRTPVVHSRSDLVRAAPGVELRWVDGWAARARSH